MNKKRLEVGTQKILTKFGIRQAPIPIEEIAASFKIKISYASSDDYSGILIRKENSALMGINSNEPETRRRFSIAHELGHYILGRKPVSIDYRSSNYIEKPEEEKFADQFAANMLMPRRILTMDFEQIQKGNFSQENLIELAKKYKVSTEAMKFRLANIGLIELI